MEAFEYAGPSTKEEAVQLLAAEWGETAILAGGTDLLSLMKDYVETPKRVVGLRGVKELREVSYDASQGLRLGALVTLDELLDHPQVQKEYPALIQAAQGVTSAQIRSQGTVGGDLCQRPRCWYYRAGLGLLAKGEAGQSLVPGGDNRYHAIVSNRGPAYFVNPSSLAPALIALGARVGILGPGGSRQVRLAEFFVSPSQDGERENVLQPNEILTEIIAPPAAGLRNATYEVRQREALDWPLVTASVALDLQGGAVQSARVVLGHVAPVPWPATRAERVLVRRKPKLTEALAARAGEAAVRRATPLSGNAYKVRLAAVAVKRAILQAAEGAV
jgi:xanthine dehydrogenase YagS FAD-binding subunit